MQTNLYCQILDEKKEFSSRIFYLHLQQIGKELFQTIKRESCTQQNNQLETLNDFKKFKSLVSAINPMEQFVLFSKARIHFLLWFALHKTNTAAPLKSFFSD